MDQLGHVNNVTYVDYLQEARVDMLRLHAPVTGGEELAEGVVVVKHEVDYRVPLVYREEPVSIETWVTKVGAASFTMAYEIFDEDEHGERTVYVQARSQLAPYVFATESPRRITETERDVLAQLSDDHEGPRARKGRLARDSGEAWRHRYDCHVRFSDVDIYRHVNNVKYFEYVQEARITHGRATSSPAASATGAWWWAPSTWSTPGPSCCGPSPTRSTRGSRASVARRSWSPRRSPTARTSCRAPARSW